MHKGLGGSDACHTNFQTSRLVIGGFLSVKGGGGGGDDGGGGCGGGGGGGQSSQVVQHRLGDRCLATTFYERRTWSVL